MVINVILVCIIRVPQYVSCHCLGVGFKSLAGTVVAIGLFYLDYSFFVRNVNAKQNSQTLHVSSFTSSSINANGSKFKFKREKRKNNQHKH